ncbi:alpha/beta hydrolase [Pedobacter sp. L105]|uniref:alpha/beta hydrolase n=1 Tax=Pedobacter sp. L105 TaxID=1641871 RepID=UPI00131B48C6|nr:alpha/beta hydrolase [Pedobacter sp. L105]
MSVIRSNTIVFLHGLFVNAKCWDEWKLFFEEKGFTCYAPSNPYHDAEPDQLRTYTDPKFRKLNFKDLVNNAADFIDNLPEKPILIGHSLGGLVVQKLLSMNKGIAGICISTAPPLGIITFKWSFWRSNFPVINYFMGNSLFKPSKKWFHYAMTNTMTSLEADQVYEDYWIPESRNIPRGTLGLFAFISFKKTRSPLLFLSGELDHIIPSSLVEKNFKAYKNNTALNVYKEFPNRDHFILGETGWQEVAEYAADWIKSLSTNFYGRTM